MTGPPQEYLFGHSATETERLRLQARMFAPYTARFLQDAGVVRGMRVLDVGTGAGDVALLLADLVGPEGSVIGIDSNREIVETARARVAAAGLGNASFVVGDAASVELESDLDAVVGRCVLFFVPDRPALVRRLASHVRAGGVVAFQEPANATLAPMSLPRSQLLEQMWEWILETYRRAGMDLFAGLRLHSIFLQAGLPTPAMHLDAAVGGGPDWPGCQYMAHLIRTILPQIVKLGVATQDEVGVDTLADRLYAELGDDGAAVTWGFITASARRPTAR
jgi:protein-L-isoaspartate O-methyltransferase